MALQCIVFDCDGVILDSVPVKTRAFARIAAPHGQEAQDRFVMYHTRHGGVSRYKKFQWFYLTDGALTNERENILLEGLNDFVAVCHCPAVSFVCMPFAAYGFE